MATPITWRNVNGGSNYGANALVQGAQESFNGMFDTLNTTLDKRNTSLQNQDTNAFKQLLAQQYQTPEALQQAQQSGAIEQLRSGFKYLDPTQTNADAITRRATKLQQQTQQQQQYDADQTRQGNLDARNAFGVEVAEGRLGNARRILQENNFLDKGKMAQSVASADRSAEDREFSLWSRGREKDQAVREDALRKRTQQGDALERRYTLDALTAEKEYATQEKAILSKYDITAEQLTDPEWVQTASEEDATRLLQARAELKSQLGQPPTTATARQGLARELLQAGADPTTVAQRTARMDTTDFLLDQLPQKDQAELNSRIAGMNESVKSNPIVAWENSGEDAYTAANRIIQANQEKIQDGWDQSEINDFAVKAMTDGIMLEGQRVKLPPSAVEWLIRHPDVGEWWNGEPQDQANRLLKSKEMSQLMQEALDHKQGIRKLKESYKSRAQGHASAGAVSSLLDRATSTLQKRADAVQQSPEKPAVSETSLEQLREQLIQARHNGESPEVLNKLLRQMGKMNNK